MRFEQASDVPPGATLSCDVCIIGSGAAGITVAHELIGSGLRVLLLEAGGLATEGRVTAPTFAIDEAGIPLRSPLPGRGRWFGGSTTLWFGRIAAPDPIDFEQRDWVSYSGWPIAYGEAASWFPKAAELLDTRGFERIDIDRWPRTPTIAALARPGFSELRPFLWARTLDMGRLHRAALESAANVQVLLGATATELRQDGGPGRITALDVRGTRGQQFSVTAGRYVLAAGGIENPRLLLASDEASPAGIGNGNGLLGRFYMDHPRTEARARVPLRGLSRAQFRRVALLGEKSRSPFGRVQLRLTFPAEVQRREGLLNHSLHAYILSERHQLASWESARRLVGRGRHGPRRPDGELRGDIARLCADGPRLAWAGARELVLGPRPAELLVVDQMEQEPDPGSRLTIDRARRDEYGLPQVRLQWRVGESTHRSQVRMHELFRDLLGSAGFAGFESDLLDRPGDAPPAYLDMKHPSGTTRMGATEASGVVDRDCRVFGAPNLYVAGSSVFPTVGHANPTLLIVALAARLAAHLRASAA